MSLRAQMLDSDVRSLDRGKAEAIVNGYLPGRGFEHSLYRGLVVEGVLTEVVNSGEEGEVCRGGLHIL